MKRILGVLFFLIQFCFNEQVSAQSPGVIYGTSYLGGVGYGTFYSYDLVTKAFTPIIINNSIAGTNPYGNLIQADNHLLYGMTSGGGFNGLGVIFTIDPITNIVTDKWDFNDSNGAEPAGSLIQAPNGLLYGMTTYGGSKNNGTIFSYDPVKNRDSVLFKLNNNSGNWPNGNLILDNGLLYGLLPFGGKNSYGTLFSFDPATGKDSVYVNFDNNFNGSYPNGSLLKAANGLMYGLTSKGGTNFLGLLFSFNPVTGKDSVYFNFDDTHGAYPEGSLMQAKDGFIYGMARGGGIYGNGVLFKFDTLTGNQTVLLNFKDTLTGSTPFGSLIQANDGLLYGTTQLGGLYNSGILFSFDPVKDTEVIVRNFNKGTDCYKPYGDPVEVMYATLNKKNINCFGDSIGAAWLNVRGGNYPLTYSWSNGATTDSILNLKAGSYTALVTDKKGAAYSFNFTITQPSQIHDSIQQVNVSCYGGSNGSAVIGIKGGVKPYAYMWSPAITTTASANNLTAGTYSCMVTDSNNCQAPVSVTITQPALLKDSTIVSTNVTCYGHKTGAAKVGVIGGTGPYGYLWTSGVGTNSSAIGLAAGTYSCIVTDTKGCNAIDTIVISQPAKITDSTSFTTTPCAKNNGSVSIFGVSGGYPPYTYSWSNGNTNTTDTALFSGSYTCTITDSSSCAVTATVFLSNIGGPKDSITSFTNLLCFGDSNGSATATSSGGKPPFQYQWSPSGGTNMIAKGLSAGTYTFTTQDSAGCTGSITVTITQPNALRDSIAIITDASCFGSSNGSVKMGVIGGTPPYTYNWSAGQSTGNFDSLLAEGHYVFTVADGNGCRGKADTFAIGSPGPFNIDTLATIEKCGKNNGSAQVTVTGGTPPYSYLWSNNQTNDSIFNLSQGLYLCKITDAKNCATKASIIVPDTGGPTAKIVLQVNDECFGDKNGSAIVSANGIPPYKYSWSSRPTDTNYIVSNLQAGVFTCTVTDSTGCIGQVYVHITQPIAIVPDIQTIGVCANALTGGSASATITGGVPPYSLDWSNGSTNNSISDLAPGSYFCKVTDSSGCFVYSTFNIVQTINMTINNIVTLPTSCNGCANGLAYVNVSGGIPQGDSVYYYYIWSNGMTGDSIISNLDSGSYSVCVTSPYGCGSACDSAAVVAGVNSIRSSDNSLKIFPVPSYGIVNIYIPWMGDQVLSVSDELGKVVYRKNVNISSGNGPVNIDLSDLPDGVYIARISNNKNIAVGKIVLQK